MNETLTVADIEIIIGKTRAMSEAEQKAVANELDIMVLYEALGNKIRTNIGFTEDMKKIFKERGVM